MDDGDLETLQSHTSAADEWIDAEEADATKAILRAVVVAVMRRRYPQSALSTDQSAADPLYRLLTSSGAQADFEARLADLTYAVGDLLDKYDDVTSSNGESGGGRARYHADATEHDEL